MKKKQEKKVAKNSVCHDLVQERRVTVGALNLQISGVTVYKVHFTYFSKWIEVNRMCNLFTLGKEYYLIHYFKLLLLQQS